MNAHRLVIIAAAFTIPVAAALATALQRANTELGVTVLIVTHDPAVSSVVRRVVAIRDGRTSTEIHRRATTGDDGEVAQHAVEYAVLDRAGLIPILSAAENVGVPLRIAGMAPKERERVRLMLDIVGLGEHARQRPGELSGGQQQRVAIARALAGRPQVLLADEPTGQLDSETAKQIMRLLRTVVQSEGVTALVATHDPGLIDIADSVLELEDGTIKA